MRPTQSFSTPVSVSGSTDGMLHVVYPRVLVAAIHVHVYCQHPFIHLDKLVRQIETSLFLKRKQCNGKAWTQIPSTRCPYLSNSLTNNLFSALLNFFFYFVLYCCAFVQYCKILCENNTAYNFMHKLVGLLDNLKVPAALSLYLHFWASTTGGTKILTL